MKRYIPEIGLDEYGWHVAMRPVEGGMWCRWEDVEAALVKKDAEIAWLRGQARLIAREALEGRDSSKEIDTIEGKEIDFENIPEEDLR